MIEKVQNNFIKSNKNQDNLIYYSMLSLSFAQFLGLKDGYQRSTKRKTPLSIYDLYMLNADGQLSEIINLVNGEQNPLRFKQYQDKAWMAHLMDRYEAQTPNELADKLLFQSRCSAIIRYLRKNNSHEVYTSHATFDFFMSMIRIFKQYDFAFTGENGPLKPVKVKFSSYPATITSTDDFYVINKKKVILETTLQNYNQYQKRESEQKRVPDFLRILLANYLTSSHDDWVHWFTFINTGTYNSQWMIVDYDKFDQNKGIFKGFLIVLEQAPGLFIQHDMTPVLERQGFWGSFNVPNYPQIRKALGYQDFVKQYRGTAQEFEFDDNKRSVFANENIDKIIDLSSLKVLIRAEPIAPRNDIRKFGAIDAKIISSSMLRLDQVETIFGPRKGQPFLYQESEANLFNGIPNKTNYEWITLNSQNFLLE